MMNLHCRFGHRVYTELNKEVGYPYFCPQCDENQYRFELELKTFDREVAHLVESSNGLLWLNKSGDVLIQRTNDKCAKVIWFDLEEYENFWNKNPEYNLDILDLRGVLADGRELVWGKYRNEAKQPLSI